MSTLSPEDLAIAQSIASHFGRIGGQRGGLAAAAKLTPEQRRARARLGGLAAQAKRRQQAFTAGGESSRAVSAHTAEERQGVS
ncbi:MAG: hypothetical protein JSR82_22540 [Verrucomicrobia bacterium]|nr:hypothetical protein [Verrucomicrobiota bacterium]